MVLLIDLQESTQESFDYYDNYVYVNAVTFLCLFRFRLVNLCMGDAFKHYST